MRTTDCSICGCAAELCCFWTDTFYVRTGLGEPGQALWERRGGTGGAVFHADMSHLFNQSDEGETK